MAYTEAELRGFKKEFARRRKLQLRVAIPAVALVLILAGLGKNLKRQPVAGVTENQVAAAIGAVIGGTLIFSLKNWRCPACSKYLGRRSSPDVCPRCGVPLGI